jgi:hypothetical protein
MQGSARDGILDYPDNGPMGRYFLAAAYLAACGYPLITISPKIFFFMSYFFTISFFARYIR